MIQIIHRLGGEIPGYRTFSVFLWRLFDVKAGHKKIARLMKEMNLKATVERHIKCTKKFKLNANKNDVKFNSIQFI